MEIESIASNTIKFPYHEKEEGMFGPHSLFSGTEVSSISFENRQRTEKESQKPCIENNCKSTAEIEEEVASLLLDIRGRFMEEGLQKESQSARIPKRKSPLQPGEEEKEELDLLENKVLEEDGGQRKRRKLSKDQESDEEILEEEKDEVEWNHDGDDDYEEDDEWLDGSKMYTGSPSMNGSRVPRKKAPSGSACEKHKRWKKRCPDDCPMRKPKHRKSKYSESSKEILEEDQGSPSAGDIELLSRNRSPSPKLPSTPSSKESRKITSSVEEKENSSNKADLVSLIINSMHLLRRDSSCSLTPEDIIQIESQLKRKINLETASLKASEAENSESLKSRDHDFLDEYASLEVTSKRRVIKKVKSFEEEEKKIILIGPSPSGRRNSSRRTSASVACEKHTALHARCPSNCPDRRPASSSRSKKTRDPVVDDDDPSPDFMEQEDEFDVEEDQLYNEQLTPKSSRRKSDASRKTSKTSRRTGRKYLPQACERHKLLHAKCPANCPDRLKRDAELSKKKLSEN